MLFLLAMEDVHPERLPSLPAPPWLNAWGIDLDPQRWQSTGLLQADSESRDLAALREPIRAAFRAAEAAVVA